MECVYCRLVTVVKSTVGKLNRGNSAQNRGWKLVGHSFKIETLLWTIIGFPIGNVQ